MEANREKQSRQAMQTELRETAARLSERELEVSKLSFSVEDLQRQLEVALVGLLDLHS